MTLEQRVAVLEEIFSKLQDYYTSAYSGEEIDARLASAGVPIGITKEYKSVAEMNQDFTGTDVQRGQFVLILPDSTASADYGKVYLKGTANWVYAFTLTTLTSIKGPIGPPGKNGVKGDPGEAGSSFAILGYFDTLDALKAAVPNPKAGDVYGVGTAPPYNIYIWDSVHGKWVANGNLQGPDGKQGIQGPDGKQGPEGKQGPPGPVGGSSNFVRYDEAQSLTDEQKAQARANIEADTVQGAVLYTLQTLSDDQKTQARKNIMAAPDGYGLGGYATQLPGRDCNKATFNGWYINQGADEVNCPKNGNAIMSYGTLFVSAKSYTNVTQFYFPAISNFTGYCIRTFDGTTWTPWEWPDPPLALGVEYRTTERYQGKPVYVKVVDCGACPAAGFKDVTFGERGVVVPVRCYGNFGYGGGTTIPFQSTETDAMQIGVLINFIRIHTNGNDFSSYNCTATVYYTKTTD